MWLSSRDITSQDLRGSLISRAPQDLQNGYTKSSWIDFFRVPNFRLLRHTKTWFEPIIESKWNLRLNGPSARYNQKWFLYKGFSAGFGGWIFLNCKKWQTSFRVGFRSPKHGQMTSRYLALKLSLWGQKTFMHFEGKILRKNFKGLFGTFSLKIQMFL